MAQEKAKAAAKAPRKAPTRTRATKPRAKKKKISEVLAATQPESPRDAEVRRTQLKSLITLGKDRGYLTYAEINDHLSDDIVDAEQIESIIGTFNSMGIQVFDEAPSAEDLLMSDSVAQSNDADAEEEAEQALSTVRLRVRPHYRPGAHVHARDGHGRVAYPRRRNRNRQAH